jgi:hypothetical protein
MSNRQDAWSEQLPPFKSMDTLTQLEQQNSLMRDQIEGIERQFA